MTEAEKDTSLQSHPEVHGDHNNFVGAITRMISKVRGDINDPSGKVVVKGNTEDPEIARAIDEELQNLPPQLIEDVSSGKKRALLFVGLGVLTIFVVAAGVELGIRHGKDLKNYWKN